MARVFYDDESIVGYSEDIIKDVMTIYDVNDEDELEMTATLVYSLAKYDNELVICRYHPMGAWCIKRLVEE